MLEIFAEQFANDSETKKAYVNLDIQKYIDEVAKVRKELENTNAQVSTEKPKK